MGRYSIINRLIVYTHYVIYILKVWLHQSHDIREFVNKVNRCLFKMTSTEHRISSAYHPQTNGLLERFNQSLQRSLVKLVNNNQDDWDELLDGMLFAYRTAKQKSTRVSPLQLVLSVSCELLLLLSLLLLILLLLQLSLTIVLN